MCVGEDYKEREREAVLGVFVERLMKFVAC